MGWDFPLVALRLTATNTSTLSLAGCRALSPSQKGNLHTQCGSTTPLRLYQVLKLGGLDDAAPRGQTTSDSHSPASPHLPPIPPQLIGALEVRRGHPWREDSGPGAMTGTHSPTPLLAHLNPARPSTPRSGKPALNPPSPHPPLSCQLSPEGYKVALSSRPRILIRTSVFPSPSPPPLDWEPLRAGLSHVCLWYRDPWATAWAQKPAQSATPSPQEDTAMGTRTGGSTPTRSMTQCTLRGWAVAPKEARGGSQECAA